MIGLTCLAVAIYFEARSEPVAGQEAVAAVVLNRVEDERYPDDICSVVFEPKAFSFTHDGKSDRLPKNEAAEVAMSVAKEALDGKKMSITSTHYHTTSIKPFWASHFDLEGKVGSHLFYTNNTPYK